VKKFTGKVAVVTGGAGGVGRAVALRLAQRGARVALWDRDAVKLKEAVDEISSTARAGQAIGHVVDVADPKAVIEGARRVESELGPVDILDNNAGIVYAGAFAEADPAELDRTIDVNFKSYVWCTRVFLPGMITRGSGHLIMTASASGLTGVPGMAIYSATKHAVVGLSESIRLELRRQKAKGIGMTIVCPSFISSGMFVGSRPPRLTRWLTPDEIADKTIHAVENNRLYIREPWLIKLLPLLKALPGSFWADWVGDLTGAHGSLDTFKKSHGAQG
jgi:all-trans-retinol dehydrogenase (NAD+)